MPVEPLGRQSTPSPVIVAELAAFAEYRAALLALIPINTPAKSQAYRDLLRKTYPALIPTITEIEGI